MRANAPDRMVAAVERAIARRDARPDAEETRFLCPVHEDDGQSHDPSARWNPEKRTWFCDVCRKGGGVRDLAERLRVEVSPDYDPTWTPRGPAVAVYDYTDERGILLFQVCRTANKEFPCRRPDPKAKGGWSWNLRGVRRVLFRLPRSLEAVKTGTTIHIVEGEKDVEAIEQVGGVATCNPGGAGKWKGAYAEALLGAKQVVVVADRDSAGSKHATDVARSMRGVGAEVRVVLAREGKDAADHLAAGHGLDAFMPLLGQDEPEGSDGDESARSGGADDESREGRRRPSVATQIVRMARDMGLALLHDPHERAFSTIPMSGHRETLPIRSKSFRNWLARLYFEATREAANCQGIQDALATLEGQALFESPCVPVAMRWAEHAGDLYLDLGRPDWEVARIDGCGWTVVRDAPVRFWRPPGLAPMPVPEAGGRWDELWRITNVRPEERVLVQASLVAACRPRGPFVVLVIQGPQGSAKTTLARVLSRIVDPNDVPVRSMPANERDLQIAAERRVFLVFDNLSNLSDSMADALCRLSTGGGLSTRQFYTDDEEKVFGGMRPVALTSIADLATRPDFLDRSVILNLQQIPDEARRPEEEYWRRFDEAWPRILGVHLDAIAAAIRLYPEIALRSYPRMADFARWGAAAESAFDVPMGTFLKTYADNRAHGHELGLEASALGGRVQALAAARGRWEGTATALLEELGAIAGEAIVRSRAWPKGPSELSTALRRVLPNLQAAGVEVTFERSGSKRRIRIAARDTVTPVTPDVIRTAGGVRGRAASDAATDRSSQGPSPELPGRERSSDAHDGSDGSETRTSDSAASAAGEDSSVESFDDATEERRAILEAEGIEPQGPA